MKIIKIAFYILIIGGILFFPSVSCSLTRNMDQKHHFEEMDSHTITITFPINGTYIFNNKIAANSYSLFLIHNSNIILKANVTSPREITKINLLIGHIVQYSGIPKITPQGNSIECAYQIRSFQPTYLGFLVYWNDGSYCRQEVKILRIF